MNRNRRRISVIILYAGFGAALLSAGTDRGIRAVLLPLFGLIALAGLLGVVLGRRRMLVVSAGGLDERQRQVRDRAFRSAYRVLALVTLAGALCVILHRIATIRVPAIAPIQAVVLACGVILLALTLPSAIMAWAEPDPPEDSGAYSQINRRTLSPGSHE